MNEIKASATSALNALFKSSLALVTTLHVNSTFDKMATLLLAPSLCVSEWLSSVQQLKNHFKQPSLKWLVPSAKGIFYVTKIRTLPYLLKSHFAASLYLKCPYCSLNVHSIHACIFHDHWSIYLIHETIKYSIISCYVLQHMHILSLSRFMFSLDFFWFFFLFFCTLIQKAIIVETMMGQLQPVSAAVIKSFCVCEPCMLHHALVYMSFRFKFQQFVHVPALELQHHVLEGMIQWGGILQLTYVSTIGDTSVLANSKSK